MDKEKERLEELHKLQLEHKETIDKLNSLCEELTGIKSIKQFVDMYSDIVSEKYTLMKAQQVGTTVAGLRRLAYER
tara:strand:+ start:836 stop:1063 length:228 start_codon:yes stop_codon:yes gene_type:complete